MSYLIIRLVDDFSMDKKTFGQVTPLPVECGYAFVNMVR